MLESNSPNRARTMRIAFLSDIHGNTLALDAVLEDITILGGVTAYWVLGDLVALGPDPVGVLERLSRLDNAVYVRGNTDHYVVADERPGPSADDVKADFSLLANFSVVAQQIGWAQGAVAATGWLDVLAAMPLEKRAVLPDGTRLLGVHVAPGRQDGIGFHPKLTEEQMRTFLSDCDADLVCVGHTHWPMDVRVDGINVVNVGCVSNPLPPDLRACYALLDADEAGYQIQHRRVDYDREAVIEMVNRVKYPNAQFIIDHLRGEQRPLWRSPLPAG